MSYFNYDGVTRAQAKAMGTPAPAAGKKAKAAKKARSTKPKGSKKKGPRRKGVPTFSTYIFKTLKKNVPKGGSFGMSKKGMAVMNSAVTDVFERLMKEARNLATYAKKATVGAKEIEAATKFILSGELSENAVAEGKKAVTKFEQVSKDGAGKKSVSRSSKAKSVSRSSKAGLEFPVGRIARHMRKARVSSRIGAGAPVFVAAVLQYITAEVLESGTKKLKSGAKRITPRYVNLGIMSDPELKPVFSEVTIAAGGVEPDNIHESLLGKEALKKAKKAAAAADDGGYYYY